jgi:hypothetical protein
VFFERAAGNLRISLFFSLLAGNLVVGDRFGGAASTTTVNSNHPLSQLIRSPAAASSSMPASTRRR